MTNRERGKVLSSSYKKQKPKHPTSDTQFNIPANVETSTSFRGKRWSARRKG